MIRGDARLVGGLVLVLLALTMGAPRAAHAAAPATLAATPPAPSARCAFGMDGGAQRTINVCLAQPTSGAMLAGDSLIDATVDFEDPKLFVRSVSFALNGAAILTDFDPPYRFTLPSTMYPDGNYSLSAVAHLSDQSKSNPVKVIVTIANGNDTQPVAKKTFKPTSGRPVAPGQPLVLAAVGDGAGGSPQAAQVTNLIGAWNPNLFLYLGDVYNAGSYAEFANWYAPDTFLGRFKAITNPTIGNHEYSGSRGPLGYLYYWNSPPHYYSYNVDGWHFISLDTNEKFNETASTTEQYKWLQKDLAANRQACTIVYFHQPYISRGPHGNATWEQPIWRLLAAHHVTIALTGHDHNYQRTKPLDADAEPNPSGITEFVVGTGGQQEYTFNKKDPRVVTAIEDVSGALRLELNKGGASYQFVTIDGVVHDAGSVPCGGAQDTTVPSTPGTVSAGTESDGSIVVRWSPSTDNVGVVGYDVYRDGVKAGSARPMTAFVDTRITDTEQHAYTIVARDAAGNASGRSEAARAAAGPPVLFADDFNSGSLARWTESSGLGIEPAQGGAQGWVVDARGGNMAEFAREKLAKPQTSLHVRMRFQVVDQESDPIVLMRLRVSDKVSIASVYVNPGGALGAFNDTAKAGIDSPVLVKPGVWHTVDVRVTVAGKQSEFDVQLDGKPVKALSGKANLGTAAIGQFQLGDSAAFRVFEVQYDDVVITSGAGTTSTAPVATPPAKKTSMPNGAKAPVESGTGWFRLRGLALDVPQRLDGGRQVRDVVSQRGVLLAFVHQPNADRNEHNQGEDGSQIDEYHDATPGLLRPGARFRFDEGPSPPWPGAHLTTFR